ncbi:fimbrial protein [Bordetella trematum]
MMQMAFVGVLGVLAGLPQAAAGPMDTRAVETQCRANPGGQGPATGTHYMAYNASLFQKIVTPPMTSMPVPSNPVKGQVLMRMSSPLPYLSGGAQGQAAPYYRCPPGAIEEFRPASGILVPGMDDVYYTTVQGIGFRVAYFSGGSGNYGYARYAPQRFVNSYDSGVMIFPFAGVDIGPGAIAMIELVALGGPINPGQVIGSLVSAESFLSGGGAAPAQSLYRVAMQGNVNITIPTCTAPAQSGLTMNLPDVSTTTLLREGEGPMSDTTIQVNCTASSMNSPSMSISSSYLVPGTVNALSNISTASNKAQGVGVEVWFGNQSGTYTRPTFGLAYANHGTPIGSRPTYLWNFKVGAKLKQLGQASDVRPGPVRATATLTFTYN